MGAGEKNWFVLLLVVVAVVIVVLLLLLLNFLEGTWLIAEEVGNDDVEIYSFDKICELAHLLPNLQFPNLKYLHGLLLASLKSNEWENGHELPAVHLPCLKNLHGTWE